MSTLISARIQIWIETLMLNSKLASCFLCLTVLWATFGSHMLLWHFLGLVVQVARSFQALGRPG